MNGPKSVTANFSALPASTCIIRLSGDLAFGSVTVGQTPQRTLTIYNDGNSTLTVSGISYPTGFSGNWSGTIGAGGSRNVTVAFSPTAVTSYSGTVTVNSDKTSGTNTISCSGTGATTTEIAVTVTTNPDVEYITVDGSSYSPPHIFNWAAGSSHDIATPSPQYNSAGTIRYTFANWSDGGSQAHSVSPSTNSTFTATFTTQYLLSTNVSPAGAGNVSGEGWYNLNAAINLTATTNSGYEFANWTGDASGTSPTTSITIKPRRVTANFSALPASTRIIRLSGDLAFGSVTVGQTPQRTLTIYNDGNSTLTVSGISCPTGFSGNWSGTIGAGGSRQRDRGLFPDGGNELQRHGYSELGQDERDKHDIPAGSRERQPLHVQTVPELKLILSM